MYTDTRYNNRLQISWCTKHEIIFFNFFATKEGKNQKTLMTKFLQIRHVQCTAQVIKLHNENFSLQLFLGTGTLHECFLNADFTV